MKIKIITTSLILFTSIASAQSTSTGQSFTKISIQSDAKIFIKQDSVCSVRFSGNDNSSDGLTSIRNNTLIINGSPDNELNISMSVLEQLKIEGRGSVTGVSTFKTDDLNLQIDGDGKIVLDVTSKKISSQISGIGKIVLSGTADETSFSIPGSGKIDALGLKTTKSTVNVSGLGKCLVDVTDELNTNISGSGTVTYKTAPKIINENISGSGRTRSLSSENSKSSVSSEITSNPDTTRLTIGNDQVWIIGKKNINYHRKNKIKPIWSGFEMGINSYLNSDGTSTMKPGNENFELRLEKSISVGLNILQTQTQLGNSNVWFFTGLGITWNNYRFDSDVRLTNGPVTYAVKDTSSEISLIKSKLVAIYLTAPVMFEVFTSHSVKKAFHLGAGGIVGLRIGSHTKLKYSIDSDVSKSKEFDDFNLVPFRYGFRAAIGYGKFNLYADYYASTLFKNSQGAELYPVNVGITFIGF